MLQPPTRARLALSTAFAVLLLGAWRLAPQRFQGVQIETIAVAGPVHVLVG
jgi:hypothetical protein